MAVGITRTGVVLTVGIIVVASFLIGGLLWVQNKGEVARREEAIQIAEQQLEDESNQEVAKDNDSDTSKGSESQNQAETGGSSSTSDSTNGSSSSSELPQTGSADTLGALIAVALLTFSTTAYVASRRQLGRLTR